MRPQGYACQDEGMPRPATGQTPKRNLRIEDAIWLPALARAEEEGRSVASVVREYLATYGAQAQPQAGEINPWDVVNLVVREVTAGRVGPATDLEAAVRAAAELLAALGMSPVRRDEQ